MGARSCKTYQLNPCAGSDGDSVILILNSRRACASASYDGINEIRLYLNRAKGSNAFRVKVGVRGRGYSFRVWGPASGANRRRLVLRKIIF
jgi:hypothetical protein